jgi:hypothetical protein
MVLSVKELPDEAATTAYYTTAQRRKPTYTPLQVQGLERIRRPDGSI